MIYINTDIRIRRRDDYNLILEHLKDSKLKDGSVVKKWKFIGYFTTVESALKGALTELLDILVNEDSLSIYETIYAINKLSEKLIVKVIEDTPSTSKIGIDEGELK